jgi:uncharacterized RDD family membrane protein YckC
MPFLEIFLEWNSANGLQSRARKWLLAMTMAMFGLSTVYWILSVIVTFLVLDSDAWFTGIRGPQIWLPMFSTILLINVSTVQFRILPASYPLTSSAIISHELTRPLEFGLVNCCRRRRCLARLGPVF